MVDQAQQQSYRYHISIFASTYQAMCFCFLKLWCRSWTTGKAAGKLFRNNLVCNFQRVDDISVDINASGLCSDANLKDFLLSRCRARLVTDGCGVTLTTNTFPAQTFCLDVLVQVAYILHFIWVYWSVAAPLAT